MLGCDLRHCLFRSHGRHTQRPTDHGQAMQRPTRHSQYPRIPTNTSATVNSLSSPAKPARKLFPLRKVGKRHFFQFSQRIPETEPGPTTGKTGKKCRFSTGAPEPKFDGKAPTEVGDQDVFSMFPTCTTYQDRHRSQNLRGERRSLCLGSPREYPLEGTE